jgi:hypothetical protein
VETKTCKDCRTNKSVDEFFFRRERNSYSCCCRICHCARTRSNYAKNRERYRRQEKERASTVEYKRRKQERKKERKALDPSFKLKTLLRCRLNHAIKGYVKSKNTEEMLGCSWDQLRIHLEAQFKEGMTWDNHGVNGWHVDHIIPLASARSLEELEELFRYTNLQPLWAEENRIKGAKL